MEEKIGCWKCYKEFDRKDILVPSWEDDAVYCIECYKEEEEKTDRIFVCEECECSIYEWDWEKYDGSCRHCYEYRQPGECRHCGGETVRSDRDECENSHAIYCHRCNTQHAACWDCDE